LAILSFASPETERFFLHGVVPRQAGWAPQAAVVARKLDLLEYAGELRDLASPPGNRLEALRGRWRGFHSLRVNDRWRVVFRWSPAGAAQVEIVDYH